MRSHRLWRALSERRGEGYVDVIVLVLCAVMVLALAMRVLPVFIQKQQLDTFATELVREAEVSGRVGADGYKYRSVWRVCFFSGYASRTGSWKIRSLLEMRWRDCGNG